MKVCHLKLERDLFRLISKGIKKVEVRRTNKDYIERGDVIEYFDMDTMESLGFARVLSKSTQPPYILISHLDETEQETIDFIKRHYWDEKELVVFRIEPLEEVL